MREEMLIFGGNQRVDKILRQVVVLDETPFLARLVVEICYQFGGQPRFGNIASGGLRDLDERVLCELQPQRIADFGFDADGAAIEFVSAVVRSAFVAGVESRALKPRNHLVRPQLLVWIDAKWRSVNLSRVFKDFAAQLPVDDSGIVVVVVEDE